MFRNYLRVAVRGLLQNKGFSIINIFGLAVGLATCLLIMAYVVDELSYDKFNLAANRIYRIDGDLQFGGKHIVTATSPGPIGPILQRDYPEIEQQTRLRGNGGFLVRKGTQNISEKRVVYADSSLFGVFTLPMIAGDPLTALREPNSVVITETMARKYFNATDIVGHSLLVNDSLPFKVTGVIKDIPSNSHFHFDFFVALSGIALSRETDNEWLNQNFTTYVLLKKGVAPVKAEKGIAELVNRYILPRQGLVFHTTVEGFTKKGGFLHYSLTPLTDIHLQSNKVGELGPTGNIEYVYIFMAIAAFILLIACVNFMNLSTAQSSNRSREVGIRKVLGSLRAQLIAQFITESILISALSMILAFGIAWLLMPSFNRLAGKEMALSLFLQPSMLLVLAGGVVFVGLLAGSYPAFFLSAFRPIAVLKGSVSSGFRTGWLRNSLVVFQFGISILLIVGTIVIERQLEYIRDRKIGFDREQVLIVRNPYSLGNQAGAFRESVLGLAGVQSATMTGFLPTATQRNEESYFTSPTMDQASDINMQNWTVDDQYIPVLGMEMAKGRNFNKDFLADSQSVIVNETAARLMGIDDPVNHKLYEMPHSPNTAPTVWTIVGVVKDFNFNSLRNQVTPLILVPGVDNGSIAFRVHSDHIPQLVANIENKWKAVTVSQPFAYSFMDEDFTALYKTESRTGNISLCFSVLAIFIACLGLFGLAAYAAEQRTREIGIRKVLGATGTSIVGLLSRDFLGLVALSALIAFPVAGWCMYHWLQGFAYRVGIGWQVFGLAALLVAGIAIATVSFQAVKAALANPVKSLHAE